MSRVQVEEVFSELNQYCPVHFSSVYLPTLGDKQKNISLRTVEKSDFFTRELDQMLLEKKVQVAIHSAKDLPDPLPKGLVIAAITSGLDARDSLVFKQLSESPLVATSSDRREEAVRKLFPKASFRDVRGTIGERLELLEKNEVDAVVVAEAALIRLKRTHLKRLFLPGPTVQGQGQLAIVCREEDEKTKELFSLIDSRKRVLYLGTNPSRYQCPGKLIHYPIIQTVAIKQLPEEVQTAWQQITHLLFTSPSAVKHWRAFGLYAKEKTILAIGQGTAAGLDGAIVAPFATQEGVARLLEELRLKEAFILWPKSKLSRSFLGDYFEQKKIRHLSFDLYQTVSCLPSQPLPEHDEIVFTSPSTVDAYLEKIGPLPKDKRLISVGPITEQRLRSNSLYRSSNY